MSVFFFLCIFLLLSNLLSLLSSILFRLCERGSFRMFRMFRMWLGVQGVWFVTAHAPVCIRERCFHVPTSGPACVLCLTLLRAACMQELHQETKP